MWILYAVGSSFFAGITAILAKCGIQKTDSDVATAVRTIVVLLFSWLMVFVTGTMSGIKDISGMTLLFLVLSGLATGASWLCYFHALQKGDINKVVPIDKSSTILTILLALIFLHEGLSWAKAGCVCLIGIGTMMMITRKEETENNESRPLLIQASPTHCLLLLAIEAGDLLNSVKFTQSQCLKYIVALFIVL